MTIIGHSLGAGAAAVLSHMLKEEGIQQLQCYAFAPPMCMDPELAQECKEYVLSVVNRDDVICRWAM